MTSKSKTPKSNQVDDSAAILLSAEEQLAALLSGNAGVGGIPSMLDAAISKAAEGGYDEDNVGVDFVGLPILYLSLPQGKGAKFLENMKYYLFVGNKDTDTQNPDNYLTELPFLWVDALVTRPQRAKPIGGHLMWAHDPNGQRALGTPAVCISDNGFAPRPQHIGTPYFDFRTGLNQKIGYLRNAQNGQLEPVKDPMTICDSCPASKWIEAGGRRMQMCKDNWGFVIYSLVHKCLVKVTGNNAGVQIALVGKRAGEYGAAQDGTELPGIEKYFRTITNQVVERTVRFADVTPAQHPYIVAASASEEGGKFFPVSSVLADGEPNPLFETAVKGGFVKQVTLQLPTYPYAPNSRPELVGSFEDALVYPVIMKAVKNNFKQGDRPSPTAVPTFYLSETPLNQEEYAEFLTAKAEYFDNNYRGTLMGMNGLQRLQEEAAARNMTITGGVVAGELSATVTGSDYEEAVVLPLDE